MAQINLAFSSVAILSGTKTKFLRCQKNLNDINKQPLKQFQLLDSFEKQYFCDDLYKYAIHKNTKKLTQIQ